MNTIICVAGLVSLAVAPPGHETSPEEYLALGGHPAPAPVVQDANVITWSWNNGIRFQTTDGSVKGKLGGRIQWDNSWLDLDKSLRAAGFDSSDGSEFRRARIFVSLDFEEGYFMKAQYDFAGQDVDFKDVYVGKKDVLGSADLRLGHFKEPFSLEEQTSSKYVTFNERSMGNAFSPGRNSGIMLSDAIRDEKVTWALGGFRNSDDSGGGASDGDYAVTGRVTALPVYDEEDESLVHVGVAYSVRDNDSARFRARPEVHISDRLVDTGTLLSDDSDHGVLELAGVFGPFHAEAEYFMVDVAGDMGAPDADLDGYYAEVGYFLTGESRPYKKSAGAFDRVKPLENYGAGGTGAVEVAARYSSIDLNDGVILGGEEENVTLGVNWYLNPNLRFGVNYVMGNVDLGGFLDDEDLSALTARVQLDW